MAAATVRIDPANTMPGSLPPTAQAKPIAAQTPTPSSAAPSEKACNSSRFTDAVMLAPYPGPSGTLAGRVTPNLDEDQMRKAEAAAKRHDNG
jgi:hypothetical protein